MTQLEYIHPAGHFKGDVPLSPATKAGNLLHISGTPGFDSSGNLAVGDFAAQMLQVMENITRILNASGAGWNRVVKVNVMLTRRHNFVEMNRIYSELFPVGKCPARTTVIVVSLPHPDFLLEIECQALLE